MIKIPPGNEHTHKQTKRGMRREKERERKRKSFFARKQINSPGVHVRPHVVVVVVVVVVLGQSRTQVLCSFPFFSQSRKSSEGSARKIQKFFSRLSMSEKTAARNFILAALLRIKKQYYDSLLTPPSDTIQMMRVQSSLSSSSRRNSRSYTSSRSVVVVVSLVALFQRK